MKVKGVDQALYEALFDALGYKSNRESFLKLAGEVPLCDLQQLETLEDRVAALFGCAGFLPDPSQQSLSEYDARMVRRLWQSWWQQGRKPENFQWTRAGVRPANYPERRLVGGLALLQVMGYAPGKWLSENLAAAGSPDKLRENLVAAGDGLDDALRFYAPLWGCHAGKRVLGRQRLLDIIINVMLPAVVAIAEDNADVSAAARAEQAYFVMPCGQQNRRYQEAVHRLLIPPSRAREVIKNSAEQQGAMDIYTRFCKRFGHGCEGCVFSQNLLAKMVSESTVQGGDQCRGPS